MFTNMWRYMKTVQEINFSSLNNAFILAFFCFVIKIPRRKKVTLAAREMAQWSRAFIALAENPNLFSVPK